MKKTLALVLALAMVFSTITVAFAEEPAAIGADAQVCADLGMLKGATGTVDAAYLATAPTRLQAAIMFLRLKGLEAEAMAFTGSENFADASSVAWAEGKNILAYLKAHPELGWAGDGTNFAPNGAITAQQYYKVMLEALGYKQNTAAVVGDFTWENVIAFAAEKGLTKVAAVANFTVNDVAVATVEALKANVKEGGKTLVASLVEAGKVDSAKAEAAGLYTNAATTSEAALKAVKAIGNTAVEVEFTADVEKAYAENVANYSIVEAGTTTALEVSAALLDGTKKAVLTTAAMTAGKTYALTVGEVKINFGGKAKITGAPELDKVAGTDTETVELTFDKVMDLATATDVASYTIAGVTVEKAELSSARTVVTLTTKGMAAGKSYTVKVTNVKSVDGAVLKSASKSFYSKSDKIAPKLASVTANTFKRITVVFNELVTTESAENIENYTIKAGSTELEIEKIVDVTGSSDDVTTVEITTAAQKSGTKYEVAVLNVVDQAVLANKITRASKMSFTGKAEDKTAPTLGSPAFDYVARNMAVVYFNDTNGSRLDKDSALNIGNYAFNNDITIEKVELLPGADDDFSSVLLTTSEFGAKSSYELKVVGIRDEYGNEMKEKKATKTYIKANAIASTQVDKAYATKATEVKIAFTKEINAITGKDVANYSINEEIGTPLTAKVSSNAKTVTLTVPELTAGKTYTITINGVQDLAGNTLVNVKPKFVGLTTANDLDAPEIEEISAVNDEVVRIRFSEAIKTPVGSTITIEPYGSNTQTTLRGKVAYEDNTVVEFSAVGYTYPTGATNLSDIEYELTGATGIEDKAGNDFAPDSTSYPSFYGVNQDPERLDFSWEQTAVNTFKLTFSEKVVEKSAGSATFDTVLNAEVDSDDATIAYLKVNSPIKVDRTFTDNINSVFESYHSVQINNLDNDATHPERTILTASLEDTEDPYIEKVEATYRDRVVITFNEDLRDNAYGTYTVKYFDENGKEKSVLFTVGRVGGTENKVQLSTTTVLDSNYTYTLKVTKGATDLAGNTSEKDEEYSFEGSDLTRVDNYLRGVELVNGTDMTIFSSAWAEAPGEVVKVVYGANNTEVFYDATVAYTTDDYTADVAFARYTVNSITNLPLQAFAEGTTYTVKVGSEEYEFDGIVETGINVVKNGSNFEVSYADMAAGDVIVIVGNLTNFAAADNTAHVVVTSDVTNGYWSTTAPNGRTLFDVLVVRGGQVMLYDQNVSFE